MIEKALIGNKKYWAWIGFLMALIVVGLLFYLRQLTYGLTVTGMSRDVTWGFYIAQFTFMVGVAASAVMVVLPYYLHNYKAFGKIVVLGEFVAIPSVIVCMLFVFVDMGQPFRVMNIPLHPTPSSLMFWDMMVLSIYLLLNVLISRVTMDSERKGIAPPKWIKPFIYVSIPAAISIHTVTAFLYSGLSARAFWMTAVLAPRFLASAFASGPALLILLVFIIRRISRFDPGKEAVQKLAQITTYAMVFNIFLVLMELFTTFYSSIPEHIHHFEFLFVGLDGNTTLVPWMWTSAILAIVALILLINPKTRKNENLLAIGCVAVFGSIWIDKGLGMVVAGFTPNPFDRVTAYWPTAVEFFVSLGVYAIGILLVTVFYKMTLTVRGQIRGSEKAAEVRTEVKATP
jgi:molybdopterin-containing oxidoreductase family membrane subunit